MNCSSYKILLIVVLSLLLTNCAKRGRPTGGKKDSIAPLLVSATPNHESINFKAKKIKISFDEYIKLKDVNKQLVISPPLKNAPIITPVGTASKFINIKILDTLKENTTYSFNFGSSIVDNNEENKLEHFKYVVSTGTYIDSLKIKGTILDAFNQKTDEHISVMLYEINEQYTDSIIYKEKPMYVSSTIDTTSNFELTNLKAGNYFVLAIKQPSNNYIYNVKQDKIGFLKDTISIPEDSVVNFTLFKEILPFKLSKPLEASKGHILFGFQGKGDGLTLKLLDSTSADFNKAIAFERGKDTLNFWYTNSTKKDSLIFEVTNLNFKDTVTVKLRSSKQDSLQLSSTIKSTLELRDTFSISSNIPITNVDTSKITLIDKDSIAVKFSTEIDSYKNKIFINFKKKIKAEYNLQILPNSITDIFENTNDTLSYKFSTKTIESYGTIILSVSNVKSPTIIEIITEKGEVIETKQITTNQTLSFIHLTPRKYIFRAIYDDNNNGVWDTGNFLQKKYPEKVVYFNKEIDVTANFDYNEIFILE